MKNFVIVPKVVFVLLGIYFGYMAIPYQAQALTTNETITGANDYGPTIGNPYVGGWACVKGQTNSISVNLYAGGGPGVGTLVENYPASNTSNTGVGSPASFCGTNASNYRFWITLTGSQLQAYGGKLIYVYGVSSDGVTAALNGSGTYTIPTETIVGWIDSAPTVGNPNVGGWACMKGQTNPINVNFYAGGVAGVGTLIGNYSANNTSSTGVGSVASNCGTNAANYRFNISLPGSVLQNYGGKSIYVYGVTTDGVTVALNGSGYYNIVGPAQLLKPQVWFNGGLYNPTIIIPTPTDPWTGSRLDAWQMFTSTQPSQWPNVLNNVNVILLTGADLDHACVVSPPPGKKLYTEDANGNLQNNAAYPSCSQQGIDPSKSLNQFFNFLKTQSHPIYFALGTGMLMDMQVTTDPAISNQHCISEAGNNEATVMNEFQKIKDAGGTVDYFQMDEPFT